LVLTIKIASQEFFKISATKQVITDKFWKWIFNVHNLKPSGNYTCHLVYHLKTPPFAHTAHLCIWYFSHDQHYLFPQNGSIR
jgi:hypothetical protein